MIRLGQGDSNMNNDRFSNHVAVVTGGASGIGLGISAKFVAEGANVIALGRNEKTLRSASNELGSKYIAEICDVTDEQQIMEISRYVKDSYGKLDILVNNAGGLRFASPEQIDEDLFRFHFDIMVKGPMLFVKHFAPLLRKSPNPSIINISSIAAHAIYPNHSLYSSAKQALEKYTQHLVRDLWGIRSNVIHPGFIDTPIWESGALAPAEGKTLTETINDLLDASKKSVPVGRIGTPDDVAECALFLCSDRAGYINGASIAVDGGMLCSGCGF
jgi:NAD(P)-dependent dehydrogenase (short-subunit alcohol dehydrogenase family)